MKILYVTTIGGTMRFFKQLIHKLVREGNTVDIAANETDSKVPECYREWGCKVYPVSWTRAIACMGNYRAIRELREVVLKNEYDIVHCHTPVAAACARVALRRLRKKGVKVVYTAHGFHFFKGAPLKNWLFYFTMEWWCAHWTDVLITINHEDYRRAKKCLPARKVVYVPGVGIDLKEFDRTQVTRTEKRKELGIAENEIALVSVGELNKGKNHILAIRAMEQMGNPDLKYFICGKGILYESLSVYISQHNMGEQIKLLGQRNDVPDILSACDIFVFPSFREGLPVALMEAIASKKAVACSNCRGNTDLVTDTRCYFNQKSVNELVSVLNFLINRDNSDIIEENYSNLLKFQYPEVEKKMLNIYNSIAGEKSNEKLGA